MSKQLILGGWCLFFSLVTSAQSQDSLQNVISLNTRLGGKFLGRELNYALIEELHVMGIDACGENGEFHTLVVNCPLFSKRIEVDFGKKQIFRNYCFIEMISQ